jgi:NAD(P)H-flavin reductase/hemoglobin-like flavoprotein
VPLHFYSYLFVAYPHLRDMFPLSMAAQRDRLVAALGAAVAHVDRIDEFAPLLSALGRDHRKFGVTHEHFKPVGEALIATIRHFSGDRWSAELAADWATAFDRIAGVMVRAGEDAARSTPPWWHAEVVRHEQRAFDIAVLTLRPDPAYGFRPGQAVSVECHLRPRMWRHYSVANAPRSDGTIDLHVRQVPGGQVSTALVNSVRVGDALRLGPPVGGGLTLDPGTGRNLLLIGGGTGLAPLKALVEQVAGEHAAGAPPRQVTLVAGARTARSLYDAEALRGYATSWPWLRLVPALSEDPGDGENLDAVDAALRLDRWQSHEVFVCGTDEMVSASVKRLVEAGIPESDLRVESAVGFAWEGGRV